MPTSKPVPVPVDKLRPGAYIILSGSGWMSHPFLFSQFKIKDEKQIRILKSSGIETVLFVPDKSDIPLPLESDPVPVRAPAPAEELDPEVARLWEEKKARIERVKRKRESFRQCEQEFQASVQAAAKINAQLLSGSPETSASARIFVDDVVRKFFSRKDAAIQLLSSMNQDEGLAHHSLNVLILSMMFGAVLKLGGEDMALLGQGALLHDFGKNFLEKKLVRKVLTNKLEISEFRKHPALGIEALTRCGGFAPEVLDIVIHHHEHADGTGYPDGLTLDEIAPLTRIAAIADTYDKLVNPLDPSRAMTPHQALSYIYAKMRTHLDMNIFAVVIRCLGVYPPGSVVRLSSGQVGMVVEINPKDTLKPSVLLYDPQTPAEEAVIVGLADEPDLAVVENIHPSRLSREVFTYLNPLTRFNYFPQVENGAGRK